MAKKGVDKNDLSDVETAVQLLKTQANNFAVRFINDASVRRDYIQKIEKISRETLEAVKRNQMTPEQGAEFANGLRNTIMEWSRLQSSDIGQATAQAQKAQGKSLATLLDDKARRLHGKPFNALSDAAKQDDVYMAVIESAGKDSKFWSQATRNLGRLGRGLVVVSVTVSIYNVVTAEDKVKAAEKEVVTTGTSFLGSVVGGAAVGLAAGAATGPGVVVAVTIGAVVGGVVGALGGELAFDWWTD